MVVLVVVMVAVIVSVLMVVMMVMNFSAMSHFIVLMMSARVGACLGLEGRFDVRHLRAQLAHHFLEDMVFRDAQEAFTHLHRHVAVAEVVGDFSERLG